MPPGGSPADKRGSKDRPSSRPARFDPMTLEPVMGVSAVLLAIGTVISFYLIFSASGATVRSVLTALALLVASCSGAVAVLMLGSARLRDGRSKAVLGVVLGLASGWFAYSLPMWIGDRSWWAVVVSVWALAIMLSTLSIQWFVTRPVRPRP